ncbi:short-chain dehydrogenase/reductase (SDR) family protein [Tieghemostelium lacteum]|uniref:Short-chain dehydrogenase/reductase (SDR) family protein n=1 Tax=Tieghemostelium lacteum TaxID=361077 RepID=A0A151Z5U7_TIELA|nr:short-chain dehydrogenase/reductase (SDR) family protein [Tieghemostelium lacteum]|eukprot:KYQ89332.1 short-chain dehydrogenase/reductase (SDR) family protein [Tieghemostelium lacteum]
MISNNNNNNNNNNTVWYITGASSGVGLALSQELINQGYNVAGTSRKLANIKDKINNDRFLPLEVDLIDENSVIQSLKKTVEKFGKLDVVVNNAAQVIIGAFEEFTDKELRESFDSNYFGPSNVIRNALVYLRPQGHGLIYNISSIGGYAGYPFWGSYGPTKFSLSGLSEVLHNELKPFGIQVVSLNLGMTRTPIHNVILFSKNEIPIYKSREAIEKYYKFTESYPYTDPSKLAVLLIQLSKESDLPSNIFVGEDSNQRAKEKIALVNESINKYEKRAGTDILESKKV